MNVNEKINYYWKNNSEIEKMDTTLAWMESQPCA